MILTVEGVYIKIGIKNDAFYKSTDIPEESVDLKLIIELTLVTIDYLLEGRRRGYRTSKRNSLCWIKKCDKIILIE